MLLILYIEVDVTKYQTQIDALLFGSKWPILMFSICQIRGRNTESHLSIRGFCISAAPVMTAANAHLALRINFSIENYKLALHSSMRV